MYGRNCVGLLAAAWLMSASMMSAQSTAVGRNAPSGSLPRVARANEAIGADADSVPDSAIKPSPPFLPTPIPQPLPRHWPITSVPSGFAQLARSAGIIFSGTVINVARTSANIPGQAVSGVMITFHVETAMRGARTGEDLTITQWIGLWSSGQRYRVGERVLLLLYPRSRVGLTSCVGRAMGRFAIDPSGNIWFSPQQILAFRTDPVLGGRSRVRLSDFASAVRGASEEE